MRRAHRMMFVLAQIAAMSAGLACSRRCPDSAAYSLPRGGYSAHSDIFAFVVYVRMLEKTDSYLTLLDQKTMAHVAPFPIAPGPWDVAWRPKRDEFVALHGDRISLFRKASSAQAYSATAISCPLNMFYMNCAWSPGGRWLAVCCWDLEDASASHKLGVYDAAEVQFTITDILFDGEGRPFWKDETTLYVPAASEISEIEVAAGSCRKLRGVPVKRGWFFGVFRGAALVLYGSTLSLGETVLVQEMQPHRNAVLTTGKYIFVSVSPNRLLVFDEYGTEVARHKPDQRVSFGSPGKTSSIAFGRVGRTKLLRFEVRDGTILADMVVDLSKSEPVPAARTPTSYP